MHCRNVLQGYIAWMYCMDVFMDVLYGTYAVFLPVLAHNHATQPQHLISSTQHMGTVGA